MVMNHSHIGIAYGQCVHIYVIYIITHYNMYNHLIYIYIYITYV